MRLAWVAVLLLVAAGCNGAPAADPISVTPAPAPTASPTPDAGLVAIDNDGPADAEVTLTLLEGTVNRIALIFLNGTTRLRPAEGRIVRFDMDGGVTVAIEPIGQRVVSEELTVASGERRTIRLPSVRGEASVLVEVRNGSLVDRVRTATGGWTVLSDGILLKCRAGGPDRLELRLIRDGIDSWSSRC